MRPDWHPFWVVESAQEAPRPLLTPEGIGDRLRAAAFAEIQAEAAFLWAARTYDDAEASLKKAWESLAAEERKHLDWLLDRMSALGIRPEERPVSDVLWRSLTRCASARDFCLYMAGAEERGRRAGERFGERLAAVDAVTARIFAQIALEERAHIALANRFFSTEAGSATL
jgi:uncharacterized ferritin-like protein (DUF455 family)